MDGGQVAADGNLKSIVFNGSKGTAFEFANVKFTFPAYPPVPSSINLDADVIIQFADGTEEILPFQIQPDHQVTVLSNHVHPKAGVTVTAGGPLLGGMKDNEGKVMLLVSTD
jgi:hypothetical protein